MREGWAEKDTAEKDAVAKDTAVTGWAEAWDIAAEAAALWAVVQRRWWLEWRRWLEWRWLERRQWSGEACRRPGGVTTKS